MILDVGCGQRPKGDVNLDLHIEHTGHRSIAINILNTKRIKNFVRGDIHHLPFKDNAFDLVFSSNVIEHTTQCFKMLKEMVRVSSYEIEIICPHRFLIRHTNKWLKQYHVSNLNKKWFGEVSRLLRAYIKTNEYSKYRPFPFTFLPIVLLPSEIHCVMVKI